MKTFVWGIYSTVFGQRLSRNNLHFIKSGLLVDNFSFRRINTGRTKMMDENPDLKDHVMPPLVLSGPSGVGKSTLLKKLLQEFKDCFGFSISHTTRSPRQGEKNGREYHFVTKEFMEEAIARGDFIESAVFSGNTYGTSKASVEAVARQGQICILDIDVQGVKQIKFTDLKPRLVFIKPPHIGTLRKRLDERGTETPESLEKRLNASETEIEYGDTPGNFDIVIVNDDVERAYQELRDFIKPDVDKLLEMRKRLKLSEKSSPDEPQP